MSAFWSMFRFRSFRIFCEKIAIFRTYDHWSEILSMSAGRPLGQGVCPPLPLTLSLTGVGPIGPSLPYMQISLKVLKVRFHQKLIIPQAGS
jgi:hypothetical protein